MKILLMGGRGALARALAPALAPFADVLTAGRTACDIELDLAWPLDRLRLPKGIDLVINLAAHFGGKDFDSLCAAENINALGSLKLCHAARNAGAGHFIQISSTSACLDRQSAYYGAYALSKRHGDELLELHSVTEQFPCAILRPSQLYSTDDGFRKHQPFLYGTLDKALRNEDIVIQGSRDARRNYLHANDLCRLITSVIDQRLTGTYACTAPEDTSLLEIATLLVESAESTSNIRFDKTMPDIPDNIFPFDDTLYRMTGNHPTICLAEGIRQLVASRTEKS